MARETIASMAVRLGIDLSDFDKEMKEFQKTWGKLGNQLQDTGMKIGTTFGVAGGAVAAGLGMAVNKAMEFDAQMSRVGAIASASAGDMEALRQAAMNLGASTSKSATEVAAGMENMAAMGFTAQEIIGAMPGVISAAEASGADMAQTADVMASTLNIFGLAAGDASKVADVLAKTANVSAADITDMQYALKYAGPPAAALGVTLEETAAAIGIMTNAGMKGEQAGTTLRSALLSLLNPSNENEALMESLGLTITDTSGNFVGLSQVITNLQTSMSGMTETQKAATLAQLVGKESVSGMLSLMSAGPTEIDKMTTALQNSGGASADTAAIMKDNLAGSMDNLNGAVETLQISMGTALEPAVRAVADGLSSLVNWFNDLSPTTQKYIAIGAAVGAGLLVLVAIVGMMAAALGAMAAAEWAVILPFAAIVAGIALLIAAIVAVAVLIYKYWDEIVAYLTGIWEDIKATAATVWDAIKDFFVKFWPIILGIFTGGIGLIVALLIKHWDSIKAKIVQVWDNIKSFLSDAWDGIKNTASSVFSSIANTLEDIWDGVTSTVESVWDGIVSTIKGAINWIIGGINKFINGINGIKITVPAVDIPLVGKVGGFSIGLPNIPNIPALATGTNYVPQDMLAQIHKGEAVVPKQYNPANGGAMGGNGMTVVLELDGRTIAKSTMDYMGGTFRTRGAVT